MSSLHIRSFRLVASLLAGGLLVAAPVSAGVVEVIEQLVSNGYVGENRYRQTFTPTVSGYITEVSLRPTGSMGAGVLSILDGAGDGAVLGSESVSWIDDTLQAVAFASPVAVTAGLTYTIAATQTGLRRSSFATDLYAGGEVWFQRLDLGGIWQGWTDCIADGVCADSPHDLSFRVVIEDSPPVANETTSWSGLKGRFR